MLWFAEVVAALVWFCGVNIGVEAVEVFVLLWEVQW